MTKELINEARRLEGDYSDNHEVMSHMSVLADALEAATRVPVQGEPNDDLEAMLRRIESFDYDSDRVSDDLEQDIRALVDISRASVPDAATAAIERIREAVSGHPECDRYSEDDVISCGWKSAYASVVAALDGAPEAATTEPEPNQYAPCFINGNRSLSILGTVNSVREYAENEAQMLRDNEAACPNGTPEAIVLATRYVGPWLPVGGEKP